MNKFEQNKIVDNGLYHLLSWFSPNYPVGSYAYSHGLEYAVETGIVDNIYHLENWIKDLLFYGTGANDAIFINQTYESILSNNYKLFVDIAIMSKSCIPTQEIALESEQQGISFYKVTSATLSSKKFEKLINSIMSYITYPIVVGCAGALINIKKIHLINSYLHAFISNILSAALRIMPVGQTDIQCLLFKFKKDIQTISINTLSKSIEDIGSSTFMIDWASANHEGQYSRLFRS